MSDSRHRRYAQLLRWYPQSWREENGRIVLDTLEQHASDRGIARPSISEAWSLRAHGLGERATPRWAAVAAATALVALVAASWILLSNAIMLPGAEVVRLLLAVFIGPLAGAIAAVVLLHRAGMLPAPAALFTASFAVPACGFAALTAASWSAGFNEADAGLGMSWFGSSTLLFLILAWTAATLSLLAPAGIVLKARRPTPLRLLLSAVIAAVLAPILGAVVLMGQVLSILGAAVVLVFALRSSRAQRLAIRVETTRATAPPVLQKAAALTPQKVTTAGAAALVSLVVGLGCAVFALTGSAWSSAVTDSTRAMNLGLAGGALAAIPTAIATGMVLALRHGAVMRWSAFLCCVGLVVEAAAQFLGAGHSSQWPLTLSAAALMASQLPYLAVA
ncbi:hypothetical protein MB46_18125 [Arthrobacter alpinus]|uniref:hypothetical protein n=1 Tax=Arthrobacter alpinus TaxID=656366 RepID=UPI0005C98459|nr:hypothetical protein [Arthrobacter alpinus]ALV47120.1 hypothetical protein MB46_18125 [Arthrobacter alpinus]